MTKQSKLVQLRRKTDRDLLILVRRELDRGQVLADVAATRQSPLYSESERAHRMTKALLPGIIGVTENERRELEGKLKELQTALEKPPDRHVERAAADTFQAEQLVP
jgi:hypothetical protein